MTLQSATVAAYPPAVFSSGCRAHLPRLAAFPRRRGFFLPAALVPAQHSPRRSVRLIRFAVGALDHSRTPAAINRASRASSSASAR